jgi:hypothetical protein
MNAGSTRLRRRGRVKANVAPPARSLTSAVALLVLVGMGCSSSGSGGSNHANPTGTTVASNAPLPLGANVVKVTTSMSFHATRHTLVQPFGIPQTGTDAVTTTVIAANPNDVYLVIDAKTAKVLIAWNESPTSP